MRYISSLKNGEIELKKLMKITLGTVYVGAMAYLALKRGPSFQERLCELMEKIDREKQGQN